MDDVAKPNFLVITRGGYKYRRRVPDDLRKTLGKLEIKQTLKTKDYAEACRMVRRYAARDDARFENMRLKATDKPRDELSEKELFHIALEWFHQREKAAAEHAHTFFETALPEDMEEAQEEAQAGHGWLSSQEAQAQTYDEAKKLLYGKAEKPWESHKTTVSPQQKKSIKILQGYLNRGYIEIQKRNSERLKGDFADRFFDVVFQDIYGTKSPPAATFKTLKQAMKGLQAARARGRLGGRPRKLDGKKAKLAQKLYSDKETPVSEICATLDISRATFYRYINEAA